MDGFAADSSPYIGLADRTKSTAFATEWRKMIRTDVVPALRRYQSFLRDEYRPRAREAVAVATLPKGADCYRARLREMTSLNLTADEIHRTGLEQLDQIKAEEQTIAAQLFKSPDLDNAFAQLDATKWQTRDEVITRARSVIARASPVMPQWFGRVPKTSVIVTPLPAAEEATAADRYLIGTIDGKRPGEYQINAGRWVGQQRANLETTIFHETIPGHHLQGMLSMERSNAHLITKLVGTAAFDEGWALYAERLADDMKLYTSDADRMGMWQSRAYRAARLVVDTGLHAFGWPRQRAVDFMKQLHLASDEEITSEVDRYIIWPGQATAYMIGALEIARLKHEVQQRLGSRFDVRHFHDVVLEDGSVPLPMLRSKMKSLQ
jgi:uncharacterized protein (DUF885 family)